MTTRFRSPITLVCIILAGMILASCSTPETIQPIDSTELQTVTGRDLRIVTGQTLYVPAYSELLLGNDGRTHELVVTLAIHNTDLDAPIIVRSVRYHDTNGNVVRSYVDEPIEVGPLATTGFLVEARETSAGWGANFIVEWVAEEAVYEPIIEAIMVSRRGTQGFSLLSLGRVISQTEAVPSEIEAVEPEETAPEEDEEAEETE